MNHESVCILYIIKRRAALSALRCHRGCRRHRRGCGKRRGDRLGGTRWSLCCRGCECSRGLGRRCIGRSQRRGRSIGGRRRRFGRCRLGWCVRWGGGQGHRRGVGWCRRRRTGRWEPLRWRGGQGFLGRTRSRAHDVRGWGWSLGDLRRFRCCGRDRGCDRSANGKRHETQAIAGNRGDNDRNQHGVNGFFRAQPSNQAQVIHLRVPNLCEPTGKIIASIHGMSTSALRTII